MFTADIQDFSIIVSYQITPWRRKSSAANFTLQQSTTEINYRRAQSQVLFTQLEICRSLRYILANNVNVLKANYRVEINLILLTLT